MAGSIVTNLPRNDYARCNFQIGASTMATTAGLEDFLINTLGNGNITLWTLVS